MSSLLSYSGLSTKIRAMQSRLLTTQQYRELSELKSVPQAVAWLKQKPAYQNTWSSLSEDDLHRGKPFLQYGTTQISGSLFLSLRSFHYERMSEQDL